MLALRICLYLMTIEPAYAQTIRRCDSTNNVDYDSETFEMIFQDHSIPGLGLVLVATTILTLGIDVPEVKRVLTLDGIEIDEEIQQDSRLLRKKVKGATAEAYSYVTASAMKRAAEIVKSGSGDDLEIGEDAEEGQKLGNKKEKKKMSMSWAQRLMAACHSCEIDRQFGNPLTDLPCFCRNCSDDPPSLTPPLCLCSGCQPGQCNRDCWIGPRRAILDLEKASFETVSSTT
ncbi:hypothetical protein CPB85DRAFT_1443246 [Mucidula mucida]|nr:hypothetical protein CPB85DRAFT_1443246 [Mucidula mucida]